MEVLVWNCCNCGNDNIVDNVNGTSIEYCEYCDNLHNVFITDGKVVGSEEI